MSGRTTKLLKWIYNQLNGEYPTKSEFRRYKMIEDGRKLAGKDISVYTSDYIHAQEDGFIYQSESGDGKPFIPAQEYLNQPFGEEKTAEEVIMEPRYREWREVCEKMGIAPWREKEDIEKQWKPFGEYTYIPPFEGEIKGFNQSIVKKTMSIINNTFKSKENKAMENFGLGNTDQLSERGRQEFVDYLFHNLPEQKKGFLEKIVEASKEEN